MDPLSTRQNEILALIRDYQNKYGYPPSLRELAAQFKVYHNTIQYHLKALTKKGYLKRESNRSRGLSLVQTSGPLRTIPLYGAIPAGSPLLVEEDIENYVTLPEEWTKGEVVFLLRVRGESMSPFIFPGDQVIVRRQPRIPEGAIGVFRLDNEVTLKRFYQKKDQVILKGDNPEIEPLIIKRQDLSSFAVLGRVIGIYRPLK